MSVTSIEWRGDRVAILDQTMIPHAEVWREYRDHQGVAQAITNMLVRGAPAIGCAAAFGVALGALRSKAANTEGLVEEVRQIARFLGATRPTAVNLFWALRRMVETAERQMNRAPVGLKDKLVREAIAIFAEDLEACKAIGRNGAVLLKDGMRVLTHCNAGALATAGYGTALGIVRAAVEQGKRICVFADETRPFMQGSRLTMWELMKDGIDVTLITDSMAGHFMHRGEIDAVIVGADRIVRNGDVANKIGTYSVAVLAKENQIPFYVAAPISTIDLSLAAGSEIPIEERREEDVLQFGETRVAPAGARARHPAFDVTPARYVTAIVTEKGILKAPYELTLAEVVPSAARLSSAREHAP